MLARLKFVVPFAQLLFNFLGHQVNRLIKVGFTVFGKYVRPRDRQADGTGELLFRPFQMRVIDGDTRGRDKAIQVLNFLDSIQNVILNGFG